MKKRKNESMKSKKGVLRKPKVVRIQEYQDGAAIITFKNFIKTKKDRDLLIELYSNVYPTLAVKDLLYQYHKNTTDLKDCILATYVYKAIVDAAEEVNKNNKNIIKYKTTENTNELGPLYGSGEALLKQKVSKIGVKK
jgi:hypothetical protein